jgi:hypothetical protein
MTRPSPLYLSATWPQNVIECASAMRCWAAGVAKSPLVGPMQIDDHVEPRGLRPLNLLIDDSGITGRVLGAPRQPEVLVERDADDVGLPGCHGRVVLRRESLTGRVPLERRPIDAVKQMRHVIRVVDGRPLHGIATRSGSVRRRGSALEFSSWRRIRLGVGGLLRSRIAHPQPPSSRWGRKPRSPGIASSPARIKRKCTPT